MMNIYDNSMNTYRSCVQGYTKGVVRSECRFFQQKVYQCTKREISGETDRFSKRGKRIADRVRAKKNSNRCFNSRKREKQRQCTRYSFELCWNRFPLFLLFLFFFFSFYRNISPI